ncbi:hypothetical protein GCM10029964_093930 [Kibdelosporangium lantanae]
MFDDSLSTVDPEVHAAVAAELGRQRGTLEMIASENFAPVAVIEAQGSVLTNKYAEGYPGRRYYGGCEHVDVVEQLAIDRVKALFGAEHANVQPHSGAQANAAAMFALLEPGDTILGLDLAHGGHLTHGMRINFSGRMFNAVAYHVDGETGLVDMAEVEKLAVEHRPKMIIAGWSAYPGTWTSPSSGGSPTWSTRSSWWTWPTSPAWSRPACTRARCRTPTSSPPRPTRPSAGRAAG